MEIQNYNGKNEIDFLGTRIITVQYLGELEKYHEIHAKNYKNVYY